ncbi:MAG: carbohydrate ABC transporter permease [Lachnospirales bacterium]
MNKKLKRFFIEDQKNLMIVLAMGGLLLFNLVFFVGPLIYSIYGSFLEWNPIIGVKDFIGLDNYKQIFVSPIFRTSLRNTIIFAAACVFLKTVLGLIIAVFINAIVKLKNTMRSIYFLPVIMPLIAVSIVWEWIYHPRIGLLNMILAAFGFVGQNWLTDPSLALPSVIAMTIWKDVGYATIIFLAAIMNVPGDVCEAAEIDGANSRQIFTKITVPLVKPTVIFIVITSIMSYFQSFIQIMILTSGGPNNTTNVISLLIFEEAFTKYRFGYASALSMVLFVIIMVITFIQFKVAKAGEN